MEVILVMKISVGIDLGTTFSVAAHVNEFGQAEEIVDQARRNAPSIPSVVYYQNENTVLIGEAALAEMEAYPDKVIRSAKRFMNEVFKRPAEVPQTETPVTFSAKVLGAIKQYVEEHENGYEIENAVITVPAYFDAMQINLTKDAAAIAQIDVLGVINEPMAAAIYYCANAAPENKKFLVYDLGGGTFDVVVIDYRINDDGVAEIATLAQDGNHQLGGDDWDRRLMAFLLNKARETDPSVPSKLEEMDPHERQKLWEKANAAKLALSRNPQKDVTITVNSDNFEIPVTVEDFERETKVYLDETGERVDKVLRDCNLTEDDIDLVLLVGGSTYMPMVQNYVREKFGADKVKFNNPNLAVAYGAAIYAHNLHKYLEKNEEIKRIEAGEESENENWTLEPSSKGAVVDGPPPPTIIFSAPRSIGVRSLVGEDLYVTNMIFLGEPVKVGETIESEKIFSCKQDGSFEVPFYSNLRRERFNGAAAEYSTAEEYANANSDALIKVSFDASALSEENAYVSERSSDSLSYMASVFFADDKIKENDQVRVTIRYSQNGSDASVEHIPTGLTKECELINTNTSTQEQLETATSEQAATSLERV